MLKIVIYLGANSSTKPFCSLPLRTSMGSLDWARCYWCDYWVRNPYMYDWPWGDYGPMCEWCECLAWCAACTGSVTTAIAAFAALSTGTPPGSMWIQCP